MKKTIQIPQGNEFSLFVPFVVLSNNGREDASAALWNNVQVVVRMSNKQTDIPHTTHLQEQYVIISFDNSLKLGSYDVIISGEYEGRNVSAPLNNLFSITNWADGNYADFVVGQPIECPTQTIIGQFNTTQEIEELEQELRDALAAAEAAKEEYEEKVAEIENVAQQGTNPDATNTAILTAIGNISIDTTTIAKQGTNASATLTATQTAATNAYASAEAAKTATIDGNDTAIGVAKEIRSEVGTGSDTAAEVGTLFAVVKWVKDKVKSIYNALTDSTSGLGAIITAIGNISIDTTTIAKQGTNANATLTDTQSAATNVETLVGTPASGQPATLFAAIAAGGGGGGGDAQESTSQAILAEIGSAGSGQASTLFGAVGEVVQQIINRTSINISYDGVQISSPQTITSIGNVLFNLKNITEIEDNTISQLYTPISLTSVRPSVSGFSGLTSLVKLVAQGAVAIPQSFAESNSTIQYIDIRNVTSIFYRSFYGCSNLKYLNALNCVQTNQAAEFDNTINLIDIVWGKSLNSSSTWLSSWSPTNALSTTSSSLVDAGETFANNREKLLYNIREHIAANLPDRTGLSALTLTLHANIKAAINADTATAQAFSNKNWTIA